jgi:hypothetical protein
MKLPEYDNRPPPGTPLYTDPRSGEGDFKWPSLVILIGIGFIVAFVAFAFGLVDIFRDLSRLFH